MLAAGCAVGLGNVWRFPFVAGENGGAAFVLVYLLCLAVLGYPLLACEIAAGRAARQGIGKALPALAKSRKRLWRAIALAMFAGNAVLMMYYTDVCGWLVRYAFEFASGGAPAPGQAAEHFAAVRADVPKSALYCALSVALATFACAAGVQKGVERITKWMMLALLGLLGLLAFKSLTLPGAAEGLKFYLAPDWGKFLSHPFKSLADAMGQAFFTLSVGVGCMTIFGSYMPSHRTIATECAWIVAIDTAVALLSGVIVFPACATYSIEYTQGPGLVFAALAEVFARMAAGRVWGTCFFLFLSLAALTTVISVFECIIGGIIDETSKSRRKTAVFTGFAVFAASMPCVVAAEKVLGVEDFLVSQIWLPAGALAIGIFCSRDFAWGYEPFAAASNTGRGLKFGKTMRFALRWAVPAGVIFILAV